MTFLELLNELKNKPTDVLISKAVSILEYFYRNNTEGYFFEEFSNHKFTNLDIEKLENELILKASFENTYQAGAIWALGKTCKKDIVPTIIAIAEKSDDDNVVYQSLICVEDCDINQAWNFIKMISQSELIKSKEYALSKLEFKRMGLY